MPAHVQILADRHQAEQFAPLGRLHDAFARDRRRRLAPERSALSANVAGIADEPRDSVEQRRLAGAVQSDDGDKFPLMHMERNILQRLRLVIDDVQILDFEKRRLGVAESGFRPRRRLDRAAKIDPAHGLIRHHLRDRTLRDLFPDMHGVNAVDERRHAFHVVIDDEDRPPIVAHFGDQLGEGCGLARGQAGERLVDQHHLRIAGDRLGDLDFAQVGERQRRGAAIQHPGQSDALGDRARARVRGGAGKQIQQSIGQQAKQDVLEHRLPMQRARMLEHHADAQPRDPVRRPARNLPAVDPNRSRVGPLDAEDRFHHRRLARSIRPDEPEESLRREPKS